MTGISDLEVLDLIADLRPCLDHAVETFSELQATGSDLRRLVRLAGELRAETLRTIAGLEQKVLAR